MRNKLRPYLATFALFTLLVGGIAAASSTSSAPRPPSEPTVPAEEAPASTPATCGADLFAPSAEAAAGPTQKLGCQAGWRCCQSSPVGCVRCVPIGQSC